MKRLLKTNPHFDVNVLLEKCQDKGITLQIQTTMGDIIGDIKKEYNRGIRFKAEKLL